jgi:hypothetical protein
MAFLSQTTLDQDETLNASGQPLGPSTGAGPSLVGAGGQAAQVAPGQGPTGQQSGSGFVDLRRYLDANQEQSAQTAQTLSDTLSEEGDRISGDIEGVQGGFASEVEKQNPLNESVIDAAIKDPIAVAGDQDQAADFTRLLNAEYRGPETIEDFDAYYPLQSSVNEGVRRSGLVDTDEGRFELMQGIGGPQRTAGESRLDQFLVSTPENLDIIREGASRLGATQGELEALGEAALGIVGDRRTGLEGLSDRIQSDFLGKTGVVNTFRKDLTSSYSTALADARKAVEDAYKYNYPKEYRDQVEAYAKAIEGFVPGSSDPSLLPATPGRAPDPTVPTFKSPIERYATPDQFAYEAALESLLGQEFDILNSGQSGYAGTFDQRLANLIAALPEYSRNPVVIPSRPTVQPVPLAPEAFDVPEAPTFPIFTPSGPFNPLELDY